MDLFVDSKIRTRSRIRRGVSPQPDTKGKRPHFNSGKNWKITSYRDEGLSELEIEIGKHIPLEISNIEPLCLLPSQKEVHIELSPEQAMLERMLFVTLEDLRWSYRAERNNFRRINPKVMQEDIFNWIDGFDAAITFKQCIDALGIREPVIRKALTWACKSWKETNGLLPELHLIRNDSMMCTGHMDLPESKPLPVFIERFNPSDLIPDPEKVSHRLGKKLKTDAYLDNLDGSL